jgi:hypothetical protein
MVVRSHLSSPTSSAIAFAPAALVIDPERRGDGGIVRGLPV